MSMKKFLLRFRQNVDFRLLFFANPNSKCFCNHCLKDKRKFKNIKFPDFSTLLSMNLTTVTTNNNLLDNLCNQYGHDCSTIHNWITINGTRNDHNFNILIS